MANIARWRGPHPDLELLRRDDMHLSITREAIFLATNKEKMMAYLSVVGQELIRGEEPQRSLNRYIRNWENDRDRWKDAIQWSCKVSSKCRQRVTLLWTPQYFPFHFQPSTDVDVVISVIRRRSNWLKKYPIFFGQLCWEHLGRFNSRGKWCKAQLILLREVYLMRNMKRFQNN